jgi:hypothetical protein
MRATFYEGAGNFRTGTLGIPTPGRYEALLRVRRVGICGGRIFTSSRGISITASRGGDHRARDGPPAREEERHSGRLFSEYIARTRLLA